jgi:RNA polymerase sigma-54 factor
MMRMEHRATQSQQLVLTQKMQQGLQILQMSGMELQEYIQQELETNPFLEQVTRDAEAGAAPQSAADSAPPDDAAFEVGLDLDAYSAQLQGEQGEATATTEVGPTATSADLDDDRWDARFREGQDLSYNPDMADRQRFHEESITRDTSLRAHLLSQLRVAVDESDVLYPVGERIIIGEIDARGYFTGTEADLAAELDVPEARVTDALRLIQTFDPTGVGAHDVVECLLLQVDAEHAGDHALRTLVKDHFDALKNRQIPKIAKAMKITPEQVEEIRQRLARLNPWPGHQYASEPPQYVTPEIVVEKVEDQFVVRLANDHLPEIRVNKDFQDAARQGVLNKEERDFVRAKTESARWLLQNVTQRQQTILKVGQAIVDVQREFMEKGVEHIRPLTLQVIADAIGVHESTVARTTKGKYIQTPQGVFELKYFFSPGLTRTDGDENQSSKSVQAAVKKIIDDEDKHKPLSDQEISARLLAQGVKVARRTVTKYRQAMDIPDTTKRRQY